MKTAAAAFLTGAAADLLRPALEAGLFDPMEHI